MDFQVIYDFLANLAPWVGSVLSWIGLAMVIGSLVDAIIPDKYDKGFMSWVNKIPVVGEFLNFLKRFSPWNVKELENIEKKE